MNGNDMIQPGNASNEAQMAKVQNIMRHAKPMVCAHCPSVFFDQVTILQRTSKLVTGQDKDTVMPTPIYVCRGCGQPIAEFLPPKVIEYLNETFGDAEEE